MDYKYFLVMLKSVNVIFVGERMVKAICGLALIFLSSTVMADQFYVTVEVNCKHDTAELEIRFRGAWNEAGERAMADLNSDGVYAGSLVSFTQDSNGKYSMHTQVAKKKCSLGRKKYEIKIAPKVASGFHPEGFCAARIGAQVTVTHDKKIVANEGVDACTEQGSITTDIYVAPNRKTSYRTVDAEVFYRQ